MPRSTDQSHTILEAARSLLATARPLIRTRGITLVGHLPDEPREHRLQCS